MYNAFQISCITVYSSDNKLMKHKQSYRTFLKLLLILNVILVSGCSDEPADTIVIESNSFSYEIGRDGRNIHFTDKSSGIDYLDFGHPSYCATLNADGQNHIVTNVTIKGNILNLEFGNSGTTAEIKLRKKDGNVILRVESVTGPADALTFINIPLSLEGMPYEPFAACVLSMNLFTRVRELPALQTNLWATCYKIFGLEGAEVTLLGVPQSNILPAIRNVMSKARNVPFSDKGGAWALQQKEGYGSYLMNFGTLNEDTVDEWIKMCNSLGFNQIDNHGGGDFFRFGDFELNSEKWPDGWESFRRINDRLHKAGLSSIFHTYAFFIDKNTKYVTPVPSKDLGYFTSFTLAQPSLASDSELVVNETTENISTITGFFIRNSRSLRLGNELIEFTGVTRTPPYKFTGCKRGANGTVPASHNTSDSIFHLREMFGRFVPGPETALFSEIAGNTAKIVSECGFDGIYFDAIDGSDILGGEEYFWYYGTKFIFEVARQLRQPVGMEMSSMAHHWWHYRSRWQAWDRPVRGYKKFIDIHSAAIKTTRLFYPQTIKSNENEHGLWRGHEPLINKYASAENGSLMLPLHFGWWGNQTWNPPQVEPTFPDDIEYLCCKMIGNNAGVSMLGGADEKTLEANPLFRRLTTIFKQYEELRHANYFNDTIRAILREAGKEFTLAVDENGKWNLRPVTYKKHKVLGLSHPSANWITHNEFEKQPVKLRIEPLMSVSGFNDPSGIVIAGFPGKSEFVYSEKADGVSASIEHSMETVNGRGAAYLMKASNSDNSTSWGKWARFEKRFEPWLNINNNQGIGVWVKGDGNGQLLNIRLESPKHLSHGARGDHFIKIDFTGWKYFELVEIESSEFSNYIWPDSGFFVYDSYRHTVQFNNIEKLQLWYNAIPAGKEVQCLIGSVKALPLVHQTIIDPSVTIGGEIITFLTKMESGMFLEFRSQKDCKLYGPKGEFIKDVQVKGNVPVLIPGDNVVSFSSQLPEKVSTRVQITVISEGNPLK